MSINPADLVQMIKGGKNPQQLMISILEDRVADSNPFMRNLMSLAKEGKQEEIENIARNMLKEKGYDFDKEFKNFKDTYGL